MSWATEPLNIESTRLSICTYALQDVNKIANALLDPQGWFAQQWGLTTIEKIESTLISLINAHEKNLCNPFVYKVNGEVAGITRYMRIDEANKTLEIGGTWVARKWQKSFVNTEVKHHLLKHAFENLNAERVEFRVDERNYESQLNVLRIGATFEGKFRNRQVYPNNVITDGKIYSIIKPEWNEIKDRLIFLNSGKSSKILSPIYPRSEKLRLDFYNLSDATDLLSLVQRNQQDLITSFPQTIKSSNNLESVRGYIADKAHLISKKEAYFFGAWDLESKLQIGQLQIKNVDWKTKTAEIGYLIDLEFRKKGYGQAIVESAVEHLINHHKFNRVFMRILPDNLPSIRLAEKLGFLKEAILRSSFLDGNMKLRDAVLYSKII